MSGLLVWRGIALAGLTGNASTFDGLPGAVVVPRSAPVHGADALMENGTAGWGAGQFTKISDLFSGMREYRTLGLVWFDKVQNDGIYHQDWRIENDPQADAAFRLGLAELNLVHP